MNKFHVSKFFSVSVAVFLILLALWMTNNLNNGNEENLVTATVERGSVRQIVSVSGISEAEQDADLSFPIGGIVNKVLVTEGTTVKAGDVLVKLDTRSLYAERQNATSLLVRAVAERDELLAGPTDQAKTVTSETVIAKQESLNTTKINDAKIIENAYLVLLSSGLTAYSDDASEDALPPTISGTYGCLDEGDYKLDMYSSGSDSGYSYRLSGIEDGTFTASVDQAIPMGDCGLRAVFDSASKYGRSSWTIEVPNTKSSLYVQNLNTYTLALIQADSNSKLAEQALTLAKADATNQNSPARSESVTKANANISQAQSNVNKIDIAIADRTLTAPFNGTVTAIDILPGETVTNTPVVTLLASSEFEMTARIPEIDIGKLLPNQKVEMIFDAKIDQAVNGDISFISPQATIIDGVSYYEAKINFSNTPHWMKSGLNADVDIIITELKNTLRVPKRFITESDSGFTALKQEGEEFSSTTVGVSLEGNDGFFAVTNLNEGDVLIAP